MVVRVFVSELSGNFEVKKHQQKIDTVLDSVGVERETVDVTAPEHDADRVFMQKTAKTHPGDLLPLPPQIYNDEEYCGDFYDFDYANDTGQLMQFLRLKEGEVKLPEPEIPPASTNAEPDTEPEEVKQNGVNHVTDTQSADSPVMTDVLEEKPPQTPQTSATENMEQSAPRDENIELDRSGDDLLDADKEA